MPYNHQKAISALVKFDELESKKKSYNRFAMGIYLSALQNAETNMAAGRPLRQALVNAFTGRLLDRVLKSQGESKATLKEQRGW